LGGLQQAKKSSTTFLEIPLLLGCFYQISTVKLNIGGITLFEKYLMK
jgi:hypothetical protein